MGPKSLLNTLLDAGAEEQEIYVAELFEGGGWDFAFWQYDPDGVIVTYRCAANRSVWEPIETPSYTGRAEPYERPEKPWRGDPNPK